MRTSTLFVTAVALTALAVGPTALAELRSAPAAAVTETHPVAPAKQQSAPAATKPPAAKKPAPAKATTKKKPPPPPAKPTKPKPTFRPPVHKAPDVEFETYCDNEGNAYGVKPPTTAAKERAQEACSNEQRALEDVGWADGVL